jgi:hypothetical protein
MLSEDYHVVRMLMQTQAVHCGPQASMSGQFCALFEDDVNKDFVLRLLAVTGLCLLS